MKKHKNKIITIIFILFTVLIISWSLEEEPEAKTKVKKEVNIKKEKKEEPNTKIKVDIKGEVNNPGVYELTSQNNVIDVINMAGGVTDKSDTSNINLSKKLTDEMVIIVYSKQEITNMKNKDKIVCPPCNNACIETKDEKAKININETKKEENKTESNEKININSADSNELQKLDGIGKSKAEAIIEYRNKNGEFKQLEEIKNVPGIGEAAFEKIKENITI